MAITKIQLSDGTTVEVGGGLRIKELTITYSQTMEIINNIQALQINKIFSITTDVDFNDEIMLAYDVFILNAEYNGQKATLAIFYNNALNSLETTVPVTTIIPSIYDTTGQVKFALSYHTGNKLEIYYGITLDITPNPVGEATEDLTKLQIGRNIYNVGGGLKTQTIELTEDQFNSIGEKSQVDNGGMITLNENAQKGYDILILKYQEDNVAILYSNGKDYNLYQNTGSIGTDEGRVKVFIAFSIQYNTSTLEIQTSKNIDLISYIEANPAAEATEDLTKLQVGDKVYSMPQGSSGGSSNITFATDEEIEALFAPADELLGTWVFNETNDGINMNVVYNVNFTSNENNYATMKGGSTFTPNDNKINYDSTLAYSQTTGWQNQSFKTITITDTSSLTNREEFTTWLKTNATKEG